MENKGQNGAAAGGRPRDFRGASSDFVLDKVIFSNVFERDIRKVYIYRKTERLAKAIQLITPAFHSAPSLRNRLDSIAVGLIDAAVLSSGSTKDSLSRELLALSSLLSVARVGGLISEMNAELIGREAQSLLQEIAAYEEPRLFLDEVPTLAELARSVNEPRSLANPPRPTLSSSRTPAASVTAPTIARASEKLEIPTIPKGHSPNPIGHSSRQQAILDILRSKGPSYIKDISTVVRDVSEKTIQRELQTLVTMGSITREGERRWTKYSLAA